MKVGTGYLLVVGVAVLIFGIVALVYSTFRALIAKGSARFRYLNDALCFFYPVGVGFKAALIGPQIVRFHMSDVGFPVMLGFVFLWVLRRGFEKDNSQLGRDLLADAAQYIRHQIGCLVAGLLVSYLYELCTGWLYHHTALAHKHVQLVGDFDWSDMTSYTVGALLSGLLLCRQLVLIRQERTERRKVEEQARAAQIVARQARRQQPDTKRRPGRRGGRR